MKIRYEGRLFLKDDFTFPVSWLDSHMLITGLYGIGGRELLQKIAWDVERFYPKIGILYISQLREKMKYEYPWDHYHNAKDFRLSIPYFHGSNQDATNINEYVSAICRSFGFSAYFEEKLSEFIQTIELPELLSDLFRSFEKYVLETKFLPPEEYYTLSALVEYFKRSRLDQIFKLNTGKIDWMEKLLLGKKIFVDITGFGYNGLVSALILQTLRCNLPHKTSTNPNILIITEQGAHNAFKRKSRYRYDEKFYNRFIRDLLRDYKEKGVSLVVEEDQPSNLVQSICELAKFKIFFRQFDVNLQNLPISEEELKLIQGLCNQEALIYSSD